MPPSRPVVEPPKGEQHIFLTRELLAILFNGTNTLSNNQLAILGLNNRQSKDWFHRILGMKVCAKEFAELVIYRPHGKGSKKPKRRHRKAQQARQEERKELRTRENGLSYSSRNNILQSLGFLTYQAYLKSKLWKQTKTKVFHEKGSKCLWCGKQAVTAHHSRYDIETMRGTSTKYLWPICNGCHHKAEIYCNAKTSLQEANDRLGITPDGKLEFPDRIKRGVLD